MEDERLPRRVARVREGHSQEVWLPPLWLLAVCTFVLVVWTAGRDLSDVNGYHCYALAFWGGRSAAATLPGAADPFPFRSCLLPLSAFPVAPFHALPAEYGPLALLAFLPPLVLPAAWYTLGFFVEMGLVVVALAWALDRYGAPGAGHIWLVYALTGSMVLAAGRFDALPSACVVIALIALRRGRLSWAYTALAIGALFKFYPVILLPLALIISWRARKYAPLWRGPTLFAVIVAVTEALAALINPTGLLGPLSFMGARCTQVESLPATLGFLWARFSGASVTFSYAYNSDCLQSAGIAAAGLLALIAALIGMALTIALYWRRKLSLGLAAILLIALLILGSKVFSPQYLLWLSPLVALEYGADAVALLAWGAICLSTTIGFPLAYEGRLDPLLRQPTAVAVTVAASVRNILMASLAGVVLWQRTRDGAQWRETESL